MAPSSAKSAPTSPITVYSRGENPLISSFLEDINGISVIVISGILKRGSDKRSTSTHPVFSFRFAFSI